MKEKEMNHRKNGNTYKDKDKEISIRKKNKINRRKKRLQVWWEIKWKKVKEKKYYNREREREGLRKEKYFFI